MFGLLKPIAMSEYLFNNIHSYTSKGPKRDATTGSQVPYGGAVFLLWR